MDYFPKPKIVLINSIEKRQKWDLRFSVKNVKETKKLLLLF